MIANTLFDDDFAVEASNANAEAESDMNSSSDASPVTPSSLPPISLYPLYPSAYGLYGIGDGMMNAGMSNLHGVIGLSRRTEAEDSSLDPMESQRRSTKLATSPTTTIVSPPILLIPRFDNVWDSISKKDHLNRFEPPAIYPAVPAETHEWYKNVMKNPSDPSKVKPLFPFEGNDSITAPRKDKDSGFRERSGSQEVPAESPRLQTGFANAWDAIPNIDKIARSFNRRTAAPKPKITDRSLVTSPQSMEADNAQIRYDATESNTAANAKKSSKRWSAPVKNASTSDLNGRTSSLKEPRSYERRSDASSRDGDDEDEDEASTEEEADDREPIALKSRSTSHSSSSGRQTPPLDSSRQSQPYITTPTQRISPPHAPQRERKTSPTISTKTLANLVTNVPTYHHSSHPHHHHTRQPSLTISTGAPTHYLKSALRNINGNSSSAQLAALAIKNRIATASPTMEGQPIVRASRRFIPETEVGLVKEQTLATLTRFMSLELGEAKKSPR
jgi:hypothetical protein